MGEMMREAIDCNNKRRVVVTCVAILISSHFSQWSVAQDQDTSTVTTETTANTAGGGTAIIQFLPVQPANGTSYPSHVQIVGNRFILDGGPVRLWFDLFVSEWADTGLLVSKVQIVIDPSSYSNGSGVDLIIPTDDCSSHDDCVTSLGSGSTCTGFGTSTAPNFCGNGCCRPGFVDQDKLNWVDDSCNPTSWGLPLVSTSSTEFVYGPHCDLGCSAKADCGNLYYYGTLAVDIPPDAVGTYFINILPTPSTFITTFSGTTIPYIYFVPTIEIPLVQCCDTNLTCVSDVITGKQCQNLDPNNFYTSTKTCDNACICLDTDDDGTCDMHESCPLDPNKTEPGLCGCGVDESIDEDNNGVPDCAEQVNIPAVSHWGLVIMALLLLITGTIYHERKQSYQ